jgi:hypothetical protein
MHQPLGSAGSTPEGIVRQPVIAARVAMVPSSGASGGEGHAAAAAEVPAAPAAPQPPPPPPVDQDAAVGAFVRLLQEAPPLRVHAARLAGRAASADLSGAAGLGGVPPPGTSSGSDSSGATCLSDGRGLTLQAGLRQFSRIKERLQQRGLLAPQVPAEA